MLLIVLSAKQPTSLPLSSSSSLDINMVVVVTGVSIMADYNKLLQLGTVAEGDIWWIPYTIECHDGFGGMDGKDNMVTLLVISAKQEDM